MSRKIMFGLLVGLALASSARLARSQWVAYNDHYQGPASSANCTFWNVFTNAAGAPGNAGYLQDIVTGAPLPVWVTIANAGGIGGGLSGAPNAGTPAAEVFGPYIDFGNSPDSSTDHAIQLASSASVTYIFTNLDVAKRYQFTATAIRGTNGYENRWTACQMMGAAACSSAHSSGVMTSAQSTNLTPAQAALNSGNNTAGGIFQWQDIVPGDGGPGTSGGFSVRVRSYTNWIPSGYPGGPGYANGAYGYGFNCFRLEEIGNACSPAPVSVLVQPASRSALAGGSTTFSLMAGGCPIFYQWLKAGAAIPDATNATLPLANLNLLDAVNYSVVLSNQLNSVTSALAHLTVSAPGNLPYYFADFEQGAGVEWSLRNTDVTPLGQRRFLGQFGAQTASLTLSNLPPHTNVLVYFDLFSILSWDGNSGPIAGPDLWSLRLRNGPVLLNTTFHYLNTYRQAFPDNYPNGNYAGLTGAYEIDTLGYIFSSNPSDAVYRLAYSCPHTNAWLILDFIGAPTEGLANESWGLDNVSVSLRPDAPNPLSQIITPPQPQIVPLGGKAGFNVEVSGPGPFSYQWKHNGTNLADDSRISGAQSSFLYIGNVIFGDQGTYTVQVIGPYGSGVSQPAPLRFTPPGFSSVRQMPGTAADYIYRNAVAIDAEGNVWVTGSFEGTAWFGATPLTSAGGVDIYLAKHNAAGSLLWARQAGGPGGDSGLAIALDAAENCYITGDFHNTAQFSNTNITSAGAAEIYLAKYNRDGQFQWVQAVGGTATDMGEGLAVDAQGNIYMVGDFKNTVKFGSIQKTSTGGFDAYVVEYTPNASALWASHFGGTGDDIANTVALDRNGNCFIAGGFRNTMGLNTAWLTSTGDTDSFLAKIGATSNLCAWACKVGGSAADSINDIAIDPAGNCIVAGVCSGPGNWGTATITPAGASDGFLAQVDTTGRLLWLRQLLAQNAGGFSKVAVDAGGNIYATGYFDGPPPTIPSAGGQDGFAAMYDSQGTLVWMQPFGGTGADSADNLACGPNGELYLTGCFDNTAAFGSTNLVNTGTSNTFLAKVDPWFTIAFFILQPESQVVPAGSSVSLRVLVTGSNPLACRWQLNGANLPLATNATLTIPNVSTVDAGDYQLIAANNYGAVTSSVAALAVIPVPRIMAQPQGRAAVTSGSALFQVSAESSTPIAYQWRLNGTELAGETNALLSITNVQADSFGAYTVLLSNAQGSVLSNPANLTPAVSPGISAPRLNRNTLILAFASEFGPTYQVLYKTNLTDSEWMVFRTLAGTGQPLGFTDTTLNRSMRFYRIAVK